MTTLPNALQGFCSRGGGGGSVDLVSVVSVTLEGTSADAVRALKIWGMASYARAILKLRADVELRENILVVVPKSVGEGASASGKKKQAGLSTQDISNSNPFDVLNSIKNDYDLGTNRGSSKLAEKGSNSAAKKVYYLVNADSDSEAEEVFNETVETYVKDRYNDDDFDDCSLIDASLKFANAFDISLHGQL
ncbi:hypothetical protein Tco_0847019 [Tanacetum coccineum]